MKRRTAVKRSYHTIDKQGKVGEKKLTEVLVRNGQALLPMLELIEQSRMAIDELIDVMGRASIEAVLKLSAVQVAGPPQPGKARQPDVVWYGTQPGRVFLKERKLRGTNRAYAGRAGVRARRCRCRSMRPCNRTPPRASACCRF